jgi:ribosomal protein S18 acetylase RimI-like enzyme
MPTLQITRLLEVTPELLAACQRLIPQLSPTAPLPTPADLTALLTAPGVVQLAAVHVDFGLQIIGLATLILYRVPTGLRGYIEDVIVDEQARGRGIGEALTQACLDHAKAAGAPQVGLTSSPQRQAANRLYQRMGFELRHTNVYRYRF